MPDHSSTPFDQGLFLVHLNRGREHFENRNFADAAEELEEARRLRPTDDSVLNLLGLAYFKQEKYREADSIYRKLIETNPESYTLHFNLGLICFKLGDLDRAEATFLRALELKPENQKTHFYLGNIYERKNQFYNAIFQYRKAGANIMVKRVQDKIDDERPSERRTDFTTHTPSPDISYRHANTAPEVKINVDHIDRKRFLSALQKEARPGRPASGKNKPSSDLATTQDPIPLSEAVEEALSNTEGLEPSDTQELSPGKDGERGDVGAEGKEKTDDTIPPGKRVAAGKSAKTNLRLTEPILQDQSLAEMARNKVPGQAGSELFTAERGRTPSHDLDQPMSIVLPTRGERRESDRAEHIRGRQPISFSGRPESSRESNLYARMRRRDDIFRYLENNLMEVNFSGKVFIKQGTIYSYSGNLTFWVKPQREETVPPLVIVSGTGKLLLTDRQRDITVMQIDNEEIFVEPSHLLACQESLTPRYAVIEKEGAGQPGLHVLSIEGTGMLALSVTTSPLLITVQEQFPVNVSSSSIISWSGNLQPTIVEDEALAELMLPESAKGVNLRLEGNGRVMMEKNSR